MRTRRHSYVKSLPSRVLVILSVQQGQVKGKLFSKWIQQRSCNSVTKIL